MEESFTLTAEPSDAGTRLDKFLAARLPSLSRARIQSLLREGAILAGGKTAKPSLALNPGDLITGSIPPDRPAEAAPQDLPLEILFEDEFLAVLNKASGMVVHPAHGNEDGTVVNALLHRFGALSSIGGVARPGIVHRLDKETSGCLVVARSDAAHHDLSSQFADRTTSKIYLAVVQGTPSPRQGTIHTHIGRDPANRLRMAVVSPSGGKEAITDYTVEHTTGTDALVRCTLHTGRTHQIRVHLRHLGHPLLGDSTYARISRQSPTARLMLHAWKLAFRHPITLQPLAFTAPIPPEFQPWLPQEGLDR